MYDVAVIGKGLFGAAAARHLARAGLHTVVAGPDEPHSGDSGFTGPFGAHFDEARIIVARGDEPSIALTELTLAGMLSLEADLPDPLIIQSGGFEVLEAGSGDIELIDGVVAVRESAERLDAPPPQGYFNPRRYIATALADLESHDGEIVRESVVSVEPVLDGYRLETMAGQSMVASRVVVAAGAWSNRLLGRKLELRLKREYVLFAAVAADLAATIAMRPTVVHGLTGRVESVYTLPPLQYPDGRWYLKLGANTFYDRRVDQALIDDWYRQGVSNEALEDLSSAFRTVFPNVAVDGFHTERCVITYTTHGRPYVDQVDDQGLFVAAGGNGHGASWADGVGALTADLVTGNHWDGFNRYDFRARYVDEHVLWSEPLLLSERT